MGKLFSAWGERAQQALVQAVSHHAGEAAAAAAVPVAAESLARTEVSVGRELLRIERISRWREAAAAQRRVRALTALSSGYAGHVAAAGLPRLCGAMLARLCAKLRPEVAAAAQEALDADMRERGAGGVGGVGGGGGGPGRSGFGGAHVGAGEGGRGTGAHPPALPKPGGYAQMTKTQQRHWRKKKKRAKKKITGEMAAALTQALRRLVV